MGEQNGIVIAANFTADPTAASLHFWIRQLNWTDDVRFAPYNQVFQSLLDRHSGVNVLLLRADRIPSVEELLSAIRTFGKPVAIALCPSATPSAELEQALASAGNVTLIAAPDVPEPFDPHAEQLGDIPYTPLYFAALGTSVIRTLHAFRERPFKVIALDCDNTLWDGTCGEDGPEGVSISEPRRHLQEFMRKQRDAGMLLLLSSKNNERDVVETFQAHPDMPLRLTDFISTRINWESKALGLGSMAEELSLGLDSFILLDDSAKEIAELNAACPEVLGLELPHKASRIPHFLESIWAFDHVRVTDEDKARNESYLQQAERGRLARQASTFEEFLAELRVEIHIQPITEAQVPRVAQLTQRTNQMNTTLIRRTEQEVRGTECLTVDVSDRFGSYGLVGAMFLADGGQNLVIENLLLSCRALGRGVEQRMFARAREISRERGKSDVEIPVVEGPRNQPARDFVAALSGEAPKSTLQPATTPKSAPVRPPYARIARDLSQPAQILDAIRAERRDLALNRAESDPPRTALEQQIAALWVETLHISPPGIHQDFFDLGGHSLLAVQLFSRIRQELGAELSMDLVYSGKLTVENMAAAVELAQADPEEMDRLMSEIDNLSEEELRALLAEE